MKSMWAAGILYMGTWDVWEDKQDLLADVTGTKTTSCT